MSGEAPSVGQTHVSTEPQPHHIQEFVALGTYILSFWFLVIAITSQIAEIVTPLIAKALYVIAVMSAALAYVALIALRASWRQAGVRDQNLRDDATQWGLLAIGFGAWASMHPEAVIVTTCEAFLLTYLLWPVMVRWVDSIDREYNTHIAPIALVVIPAVTLARGGVAFEWWQVVTLAAISTHATVLKLRSETDLTRFMRLIPLVFALSMVFEVYLHAGWIPAASIGLIWLGGQLKPWWLPLIVCMKHCGRSFSEAALAISVLLVTLLLINSTPEWDPTHYGYFLYPSRDALFGKTPLVDISFQYGYLNIYILSILAQMLLGTVTYWSVAIVVNLLNIVLMLCVIYISRTRIAIKSSLIILFLIILWGKFSQQDSPDRFPSVGFLRFGPSIVVVALLNSKICANMRTRIAIRYLSVGFASVYSIECLVYVFSIVFADIITNLRQNLSRGPTWRVTNSILALLLVNTSSIVIFQIIAAGSTFLHIGVWPDWRHYTQFLTLYSSGFGFWQPRVSDPALLILIISVVGCFWGLDRCVFHINTRMQYRSNTTLCMIGALGIAQYTYYIYRPHPFNLYHIMWPSVIILYWYIDYSMRDSYQRTISNSSIFLYSCIISSLFTTYRNMEMMGNFPHRTGLGWAFEQLIGVGEITSPFESYPIISRTVNDEELRSLLGTFPKNQVRIPMFVGTDILDAELLETQKINWFPISYEEQDGLIPLTKESMRLAGSRLELGSMLIIERGLPSARLATYGPAFDTLCSRGAVVEVIRLPRLSLARFDRNPLRGSVDLCIEESGQVSYTR